MFSVSKNKLCLIFYTPLMLRGNADIHNSAIVLLMGYLCWPKYITGITEESFIAGCNRCIAFFQAYQLFAPSASRCGKILEAMQRQVFKHRNGPHPLETLDLNFEISLMLMSVYRFRI